MTQDDAAARPFSSPFEWILYAGSLLYELAIRLRLYLYDKGILKQRNLPRKVVSIGNITVGGSGKTPMVHYVANFLKGLGLEVAVVSRGYGGHAQHSGGIVSDGKTILMGRDGSGDEPQLLASKLAGIPLLVGKDRWRAGRRAIKRFGTSVLVLDDGFQHLRLKRNLDLLLLDSSRPFGNGFCLPRGTLREPEDQIKRASALILTRWREDEQSVRWRAALSERVPGYPVFRCKHVPDGLLVAGQKEHLGLGYLIGRQVFLFSGIVRNDSFLETVRRLQGGIAGSLAFPDHHRYSDEDLRVIWKRARELEVDSIITTEKDYTNIETEIPPIPQLIVLKISISFERDKEAFESFLKSELTS
jgi:tetraacyldisaccharide 4'-kinase